MGIVKFKIIPAGFPAVMSVCTRFFATIYPLSFSHNKFFNVAYYNRKNNRFQSLFFPSF